MSYSQANRRAQENPNQIPYSLDAEQAILGAIFRDPTSAVDKVLETIPDAEHFYNKRHREIFSVMLKLADSSRPCDVTTVANTLHDENKLDICGGRVYLVELMESVISTAHLKSHCDIVLEKSLLRKMIYASEEIIKSCYALEQPVDELMNFAESTIFEISQSTLKKSFVSYKDLIPHTFDEIERLQGDDADKGTRTGFIKMDEMTNGLHNGELIIVAGRPSMGKSALMMNIAEHVAMDQKKGVAVFSLEMSDEALAMRMLCGRAGVSQQKVRSKKLTEAEWTKFTTAGGILSEAPIFIDDSPTLTPLEMRAKARRLKSQNNIGLVMVDYLQMMHSPGRYENRQQEMSNISRSMKILAKELSVPVICCSQLSRMVEQRGGDKKPQLSDLRESGAIEQDADVVMFVYRAEHYMSHLEKNDPKYQEVEGQAEVIIAKQRNGPTGVVPLTFRKTLARFENPAPGYRELPPGVDSTDMGDGPIL